MIKKWLRSVDESGQEQAPRSDLLKTFDYIDYLLFTIKLYVYGFVNIFFIFIHLYSKIQPK